MQKTESKLTVYFDDPFWAGIYERVSGELLEVCKITFGAEPKDYEVYGYLLQSWHLLKFSPPVETDDKQDVKINHKRMPRVLKKQLKTREVGTKSQQALKLQHEENKIHRKEKTWNSEKPNKSTKAADRGSPMKKRVSDRRLIKTKEKI